MIVISVLGTKVDPEFAKKVEEYCRQNDLNPSSLIRSLLEEELARKAEITEKGHKQLLDALRGKGLVTKITRRPEQEQKTFEGFLDLPQDKKMLMLATLISTGLEEIILNRAFLLALAKVVNLQHFKGRLNSEAAINDFALLDKAIKNAQEDLDAAEKLSNIFKKAGQEEKE